MDGVQAPRQIRALMFLLIYGIHDELSFLHLREFVTWHRHNIDQDASQMQMEMVDTQWITSFIISPTLTIAAAIKKKLIINEEIKTNRAWLKVEFVLRTVILNDIIKLLIKYGPAPMYGDEFKYEEEINDSNECNTTMEYFLTEFAKYCTDRPTRKVYSMNREFMRMNNAGKFCVCSFFSMQMYEITLTYVYFFSLYYFYLSRIFSRWHHIHE